MAPPTPSSSPSFSPTPSRRAIHQPKASAPSVESVTTTSAGAPIRHDVAMSGEVSLRGRVLQVGGLREKALAAHRAGFRSMLYPAANEKDLDDVPKDVREKLDLVPVESMDDVFALALHRVIVPQRVSGNFIIEVDDDSELVEDAPHEGADAMIAKRGRKR